MERSDSKRSILPFYITDNLLLVASLLAVLTVHTTQDPPHRQLLERFNFDFRQQSIIKYVSGYEIFPQSSPKDSSLPDVLGAERDDMLSQGWPVPLQDHTTEHLKTMENDGERYKFLVKRAARFVRKVTRPTLEETKGYLEEKVDSLVIATRDKPLVVLRTLLPYLAPSCPFVIFSEHIQPLAVCFDELKTNRTAIKLQLSETWKREFQMLVGRTHPEMNMDATGGYILTGCKVSKKEIKVEKKGKLVGLGAAAARHSGRGAVQKKLKERRDEGEEKVNKKPRSS